jgi:hypothetical protein
MTDDAYAKRLDQQIKQYANLTENMHKQDSQIGEYYKDRYTRQASRQVLAANSHIEFYANFLKKGIERTGCADVVSIGSGDGSLEIQIAKKMRESGVTFRFHLLELSPILLESAGRHIAKHGMTDTFKLHEVDLNNWQPDLKYAGVMAHHSLHHIENLEHLFAAIEASLLGYFCTMDMIGRNGHMRWPETLELIQLIWNIIPQEKRQHSSIPGFEEVFRNFDCSNQGFEGIRSQDILPELVKRFGFEVFYAFGGLIDPFIGRGFRQHYDPSKPEDRALIDLVGYLNELLLDLGHIKPTQMAAAMTLDKEQRPRIYRNRTPEFCIRWPGEEN